MKHRIFIDGQEGTTGLQIHARLASRPELQLLEIAPEQRKDPAARQALMREADLVVLCLPDAAAVEAVTLAAETSAKLLDASSAHRTADGWVYGLPELAAGQRNAIRSARRVSNPGCYPTGCLLAVRPLVDVGILPPDYPVTVHAVSGYSGGGKKMIEAYSAHDHSGPSPDWMVRPYGLTLAHKHVPEMRIHAGLAHNPLFCPAVSNFYQGMLVSVPLHGRLLGRAVAPQDVHAVLSERYAHEPHVRVLPLGGGEAVADGFLSPVACNGTNTVELVVSGNPEQLLIVARLDNLGKGASSAAVQNLNLMLGLDEHEGLDEHGLVSASPRSAS